LFRWLKCYASTRLCGNALDLTLEDTLRYREVGDEVKGVTFKHRIAEMHAISIKRLSKIEATDDPTDGAYDE
jgi:single-strand DNA-binding protein